MASQESDEDDYMSDALLAQCEGAGPSRPGLLPKHVARKHKLQAEEKAANVKNYRKPVKQLEQEKRQEGLSKNISSDNKGFALLQKMGYKPGMSLGKQGTGRKEPVPVELKSGRGGLGKEADLKRKQINFEEMRATMKAKRARMEQRLQRDFLTRGSDRFGDRRIQADLYSSQKVCAQLDSQKDIETPSEPFFWPEALLELKKEKQEEEDPDGLHAYEHEESDVEEEEDEEEDDAALELSAAEKLEILTMYLRNKHKYCLWCGTAYNDKEDLRTNCPGNTADAHD